MADEFPLDAVDRRILRALQRQGRLKLEELARDVALSASATQRRVRRLEAAGVITGYHAVLAPDKLGLPLTAYISVRLTKAAGADPRSPVDSFAAAVQAWPEVVECAALTGDMDYLLRVVVRDMAHHARFIMDQLLKHPTVQDCKTSFLLRALKTGGALPL